MCSSVEMCDNSSLSDLSREELYSLVNRLKRENSCLTTDLIRFKLLLNYIRKHLTLLDEMNETNKRFNTQCRQRLLSFAAFDDNKCFVDLKSELS